MSTIAEDWRTQAACRDLPTRLFYPQRGRQADLAKGVCERCPVAAQCKADGEREPYGVWGGTSVDDRGGIASRGQAHRLEDVRACVECDARVWAPRNVPARGFRCDACRFDDEDVA